MRRLLEVSTDSCRTMLTLLQASSAPTAVLAAEPQMQLQPSQVALTSAARLTVAERLVGKCVEACAIAPKSMFIGHIPTLRNPDITCSPRCRQYSEHLFNWGPPPPTTIRKAGFRNSKTMALY